ncbi:flagellar type III secretion system protein FlhB [Acetobacter estunensis]|uniref:EscU/YscU/HrcU family type III secretion system export apparatus switch protein n=1 Tax=Acetobacter estunensis TaxID=104097 RepID=UPI001C2D04C6|nr:flagellar type III secretion system protein FlhB [Acetobacter estunensis]
MADSDTGDTTEAPTGRRLERAREQGNIAQSRELHLFSGLGLATLVLTMAMPAGVREFIHEMSALLDNAGEVRLDPPTVGLVLTHCLHLLVVLAFPVVAATAAGGVATALLQSGFLVRMEALVPDIGRLNPLKGLKKLFGVTNLVEATKSIAKIIIFSAILYGIVRDTLALAPGAMGWSPERLARELSALVVRTLGAVLIVQVIIVVLDEAWTRYKRLQDLKMSRHDIKEEMKESEGDPHIRAKLKQMRMQRTRKRVREAVRSATVVVTNPTHYAVALAYEPGSAGAPRIVAKGADELAARIREFAWEEKVPIVSNPPLARSLYQLPEDTEIPYDYFQAVAAVIAYVWRLKKPAGGGSPPVM